MRELHRRAAETSELRREDFPTDSLTKGVDRFTPFLFKHYPLAEGGYCLSGLTIPNDL